MDEETKQLISGLVEKLVEARMQKEGPEEHPNAQSRRGLNTMNNPMQNRAGQMLSLPRLTPYLMPDAKYFRRLWGLDV